MLWCSIRSVGCGKIFKKFMIGKTRYSFHYNIINKCCYVEFVIDF